MGRSSKDGSTRLRSLAAALARRHPLILDGLCLHVLSSFQRTGAAPATGRNGRQNPKPLSWQRFPATFPPEGEPYKFTISVNRLSTQIGHRYARLDPIEAQSRNSNCLAGRAARAISAERLVRSHDIPLPPPGQPRRRRRIRDLMIWGSGEDPVHQ